MIRGIVLFLLIIEMTELWEEKWANGLHIF